MRLIASTIALATMATATIATAQQSKTDELLEGATNAVVISEICDLDLSPDAQMLVDMADVIIDTIPGKMDYVKIIMIEKTLAYADSDGGNAGACERIRADENFDSMFSERGQQS